MGTKRKGKKIYSQIISFASPTFSMLSEADCSHGITLLSGSVPESSNGRLYNTSCVFGPDGLRQSINGSTYTYVF